MTDEMDQRLELIEHVERPRRLSPAECESTIRFAKDEDTYLFETFERTIVETLLEHALGDVVRVYTQYRDETFDDYHGVIPSEELDGDEYVIGVAVRLPVGTLTVKGSSRSKNNHSSIVNTPSDVEQERETFANDD